MCDKKKHRQATKSLDCIVANFKSNWNKLNRITNGLFPNLADLLLRFDLSKVKLCDKNQHIQVVFVESGNSIQLACFYWNCTQLSISIKCDCISLKNSGRTVDNQGVFWIVIFLPFLAFLKAQLGFLSALLMTKLIIH